LFQQEKTTLLFYTAAQLDIMFIVPMEQSFVQVAELGGAIHEYPKPHVPSQ
jgi:hypothetical protein